MREPASTWGEWTAYDATLLGYRRKLDRRLVALLAADLNGKAGLQLKWAVVACRQKLFVFVTRRNVPDTNNVSERALRQSVIFRKVTNGFRSAWGAEVYADIRSIVATGQLYDRSTLTAIRQVLGAGSVAAA
jgi:transposase